MESGVNLDVFEKLQEGVIDMSILPSKFGLVALDSVSAFALAMAISVAVAALAIRAGRWKLKMGLLPGFKIPSSAKAQENPRPLG